MTTTLTTTKMDMRLRMTKRYRGNDSYDNKDVDDEMTTTTTSMTNMMTTTIMTTATTTAMTMKERQEEAQLQD